MRKKNIAIVTLAVALEGEKGYSRFRFLSDMLSEYYHVDLITSSFQHWEKKQRGMKENQNDNSSYRIIFAYEPGYKRNVDLRRVYSHRIAVKNIKRILSQHSYDLIYCIIPDNYMAAEVGTYAKNNGIKFIVDVEDLWPEAMEMISPFPKGMNRLLFGSYRKSAQKAYNCADAFVGTSDEYRDIPYKKYGICYKPAITVYVGCDLDEFDAGVRQFSDEILKDILGAQKDLFIRQHGTRQKKVNLSKEQISNILGSWKKAKLNSGKKTEIIDDIYYKIKNHICGVYEYHTNLSGKGPLDRCSVLVISEEECYLKNPEGICYTFKIKP